MTTHATGALWTAPDQMPSCDRCLDGDHPRCRDLMETAPWGLHACGCRNVAHEVLTYNETRFACRCGRFLAESSIRSRDYRDDGAYYGVGTDVEWDCSRCGTVKGESWEPSIVITATRELPRDSAA